MPVDGRTDLYACGAVLFECLVGRPVFEASNVMTLVSKHMEAMVPDNPSTLNPAVPQELSRIDSSGHWPAGPRTGLSTASDLLRGLEKVHLVRPRRCGSAGASMCATPNG